MIGAGRRDSLCTFQAQAETTDGGGGVSLAWQDQFTEWGAIALPNLRSQQESIAGGAVQSVTAATLTVPDNSNTRQINAGWRVSVRDRMWNVRQVNPSLGTGLIRMTIEAGVPT